MSLDTLSQSLVPKYKEKLLGTIEKVNSPEDWNTVVTNVPKKEKVHHTKRFLCLEWRCGSGQRWRR